MTVRAPLMNERDLFAAKLRLASTMALAGLLVAIFCFSGWPK
jgi:hypothetical protein